MRYRIILLLLLFFCNGKSNLSKYVHRAVSKRFLHLYFITSIFETINFNGTQIKKKKQLVSSTTRYENKKYSYFFTKKLKINLLLFRSYLSSSLHKLKIYIIILCLNNIYIQFYWASDVYH